MSLNYEWLDVAFSLGDPDDFGAFVSACDRKGVEQGFGAGDYRNRVANVRRLMEKGIGHQEAYAEYLESLNGGVQPQPCCKELPPKMQMLKSLASTTVDYAKSGFENATDDEYERRLQSCRACEWFLRGSRCRKCGCFMDIKARIQCVSCPVGRW